MKIIARLKVNRYTSREQVILGLTEAGYIINIEEKKSEHYYIPTDYYIIVRKPDKEKE